MERKNIRYYVTPFAIFWSILIIILTSTFFAGCSAKSVYVLFCLCKNENQENMKETLEENGFAAVKDKWRDLDIFIINTYTKLNKLKEAKACVEEVIDNVKFASLLVSDDMIDYLCVIKNENKKAMLRIKAKEMLICIEKKLARCSDCNRRFYEGVKMAFGGFEKDFQTSSIDELKLYLCASIGACLLQNFG